MNARQVQRIMQTLRDVAETHPNDLIAINASKLASRMETMPLPVQLDHFTDVEIQLIRYCSQWHTQHSMTHA
jgi:hypothetical protein